MSSTSLHTFQYDTCGDICKTSIGDEKFRVGKSKIAKTLKKNFDCHKIWNDKFIDLPGTVIGKEKF